MSLQEVFKDAGISVHHFRTVGGGDINQAYSLETTEGKLFLKINDAHRYPSMFEKEADGLKALGANGSVQVPSVIRSGIAGDVQYLLLEWLESGSANHSSWSEFGRSLARLHQAKQSYFGWNTDNYIGSLQQLNDRHDNWASFYSHCRILPLVKQLFHSRDFSKEDMTAAEKLCAQFDNLFPLEPPSLLHGDLWSGNYLITHPGDIAVIDPAVYYGHREMDLGMTRLFGWFAPAFYDAYHEQYPLLPGWEKRVPLTQLYPLLVHAVLFGGHYVEQARRMVRS